MGCNMTNIKTALKDFGMMDVKDKRRYIQQIFLNNVLYVFIILAIIYVQVKTGRILTVSSIVNLLSLTASNLPIALGIAGAIVLTGTDLSAGRTVGLTACICASLIQQAGIATKMWVGLDPLPIPLLIIIVMGVGALVGFVNGYSVAKFKLHPFIVTLATQLIIYGILLIYLNLGNNRGQSISSLTPEFREFIVGQISIGSAKIPYYVIYAFIIMGIMWFIWNKTTFGKNMFAVGANESAAEVSGVNVGRTIIMVFMLAGMMYGLTGLIESARVGSNNANIGFNYELDAIAACVIGGVSFVGGIGKISGIFLGVLLLRVIFVCLTTLGVDQNMVFIIKGLIILVACAIDMRKYLTKK